MAECLVQDTSLVSIADAIRDKTGISETLNFPTGFISAINSIGNSGEIKFSTGTMTFDSNYYVSSSSGDGTEVVHGLGVIPDAIFIHIANKTLSTVTHLGHYFGTRSSGIFNPNKNYNTVYMTTGTSSGVTVPFESSSGDFTSSSATGVRSTTSNSFYFAPPSNMMAKVGEEYVWFAIGKIS